MLDYLDNLIHIQKQNMENALKEYEENRQKVIDSLTIAQRVHERRRKRSG